MTDVEVARVLMQRSKTKAGGSGIFSRLTPWAPKTANSVALCLTISNEEVLMDTYYNPADLAKFSTIGEEAPELWAKFQAYYGAVFAEGALTAREKSLIALAVAHAVQCPYCIHSYAQDALEKGANEEQMTEAIHVAAAIRGGATLVHGVQMKNITGKLGM
jgi:alkylhydroperoxidase/carboxymuconolactone decarboxylase family protein